MFFHDIYIEGKKFYRFSKQRKHIISAQLHHFSHTFPQKTQNRINFSKNDQKIDISPH